MKPLVLEMHAFGPFAAKQVIDFSLLQRQSKTFFLIHGPTGSGKTSILDAMCFALFGVTSGGEREGMQMRSHHAEGSVLTEVRFDFELAGRRLRVHRIPKQKRPARRGAGETDQLQSADFYELDPKTGRESTIASGWKEVTEAVEKMLGFESRQFRQVVVLPQGRFSDFLKSGTQEREKILQTLFSTELYKRIEARLWEMAQESESKVRDHRTRQQALLSQAQVASPELLKSQVDDLAVRAKACAEAEASAFAEAERAASALQAAHMVEAKFVEFDKATREWQTIEQQEAGRAAERTALLRALAAAKLEPLVMAAAKAVTAEQEATQELEKARADAHAAAAAEQEAEAVLKREQEKAADRDAAAARTRELKAMETRVLGLAEALRERDGTAAKVTRAEKRLAEAIAQCEKAVAADTEAANRLRDHEQTAQQAAGLQAQYDLLSNLARKALELERLRQELPKLQRDVEWKHQTLEAKAAQVGKARAHLDAIQKQWIASQAARLAETLRPGEACPVCGAGEHPQPAHREGVVEVVRDATLEAAHAGVDVSLAAHRGAETDYSKAKGALETEANRVHQLACDLGDGQETAAQRNEVADLAAKQLNIAKAALQALASVHAMAIKARDALASDQKAEDQARKDLDTECRSRDRWQTLVDERSRDIPPEFLYPGALQAAIQDATATHDALQKALDDAAKRFREAGLVVAATKARHGLSANSCSNLARKREEDCRLRDERLLLEGFVDLEAYEDARMSEEKRVRLQQSLQDYDASKSAARHRLQQAHVGELQRPDLKALSTARDSANAKYRGAIQATSEAKSKEVQAEGCLKSVLEGMSAMEEEERRYGFVKKVSDVANGVGGKRMSLQRYVLATLLDEVLAATSVRLRVMSRQRYELRRSGEPGDLRRAAGLDLEVFDHYTGLARATETLSGGEQFLTSLALALGLSDVVQAHAGGIRLDAIFIDEGFGTLDSEALDLAIRALRDLQQSGRLVGIISHVAELREWIDARLEVRAGVRGSVAEFLV